MEDDPRYFEGAQLGKAQKAALGITGLTGRNTASFDPNSTLVRPSMRVMHGPRQARCGKSLKFDDVVVVPAFLDPDRSGREDLLGDLVDELRTLGPNMDLSKLETLQWSLRQASKYYSLVDEEKERAVRVVWYRDRADQQPSLHETANFTECMDKTDTCMTILTFGAQREMAWQRVSAEETVYFPLDDGAMFFCGPEVRKHWNFDTKTLSTPREDRTDKGHVAIVLVAASSITTPEQVLGPTPTDQGAGRCQPCRNFLMGRCSYGDNCRFSHSDGTTNESKGVGHGSSSTFDASKFGHVSPGKYVRPSMRVITVPSSERYAAPVSNDDVIVVPHFFCPEDDWDTYYKLIEEMRTCQARGENRSEWMSWHEGAHLLVQNPTGSATYQRVLDKMCQYFNIKEGNRGTRFNWYRDASDWKPFHHDSAAFNPQRAKNQNCTVGISFGASRELAFRHAKTGELVYFPQTNGMLFYFGRDANIVWQHGINAMPREDQDGKGRISIILWGWCSSAVEELGSPPMLADETRPGGYDGRRNDTPCRDFQRGSCKFGERCRFSHNAAGRRT